MLESRVEKILCRAYLLFLFTFFVCLFFGDKKIIAFKSVLELNVFGLVFGFFWYTSLLLRIKEKIQTKSVAVSNGREIFGSISVWEGAEWVVWGRGLPGGTDGRRNLC